MRSALQALVRSFAEMDARRHFSCCGGVADFAGLCRDLPS
jgi:hypothetical protein